MKAIKIFTAFVFGLVMMMSAGVTASAETGYIYEVKIHGTDHYDTAQEILRLLNIERKKRGVCELVLDKELTEAAMLRAAETTHCFSHTRPDGTKCFTACGKMSGENLVYLYNNNNYQKDAAEAMKLWMSSDGHRENMLNGRYKSIGIGAIKADNADNRFYAVQCLSSREADEVETRRDTVTGDKYFNAVIADSKIIMSLDGTRIGAFDNYDKEKNTYLLSVGKSYQLGTRIEYFSPITFPQNAFTWSSSNSSVIKVTSDGKLTAVGAGTAAVKGTPVNGGHEISVTFNSVNGKDLTKANISLEYDKVVFNGYAHDPQVTVIYEGNTLRKWYDYSVKYENNNKLGTAKVTVTGEGYYAGTVVKTFEIVSQQSTQTSKVTTKATTKATTKVTTKATTQATTKATTQATTKATTQQVTTSSVTTTAPQTTTAPETTVEETSLTTAEPEETTTTAIAEELSSAEETSAETEAPAETSPASSLPDEESSAPAVEAQANIEETDSTSSEPYLLIALVCGGVGLAAVICAVAVRKRK